MRFLFAFLICLAWPILAVAQEADEAVTVEPTETLDITAGDNDAFEWDEWAAFAARVEGAIEAGRASNAVLGELRGELAEWRDVFLDRQSLNGPRIATVRAQIEALGAAPESGEDGQITSRRSALEAQLQRLLAPVILADEAYTQANGLIGEIDTLIRERQTDAFTERSQSPLNPTGWARSLEDVGNGLTLMRSEVSTALSSANSRRGLIDALPLTLALLAAALLLLMRGRGWFNSLTHAVTSRMSRGRGVTAFMLSLGQILLPFLGLLALAAGLHSTGLLGRRLSAIVEALPFLGLFPIVAHWLAGQLLPKEASEDDMPLLVTAEVSAKAHRRFITLGYCLALYGLVKVFVDVNTLSADVAPIVMFPFGAFLCWTLYWVGHALRTRPVDQDPSAAE